VRNGRRPSRSRTSWRRGPPFRRSLAYAPNHCHCFSVVPISQPAANATTAIPTKPKTSITRSGHRCCEQNRLICGSLSFYQIRQAPLGSWYACPEDRIGLAPQEHPLARNERLPPRWDIYLVRSTPAQLLGRVEAPNADAAIEAAVRAFGINDGNAKRLTAILKSRHPRPRDSL
jgi:hypothetical protein